MNKFDFVFVSASNFFLYAFTGRIFRHELRRLFTCDSLRFFSLTSSQRLRRRAKKFISGQNRNQNVHEAFYSRGQRQTNVLIVPKQQTNNRLSQPSLTSAYSLSHLAVPKTMNNRQVNDSTSIVFLEKSSFFSLAETIQPETTNRTILLHSPKIKPVTAGERIVALSESKSFSNETK